MAISTRVLTAVAGPAPQTMTERTRPDTSLVSGILRPAVQVSRTVLSMVAERQARDRLPLVEMVVPAEPDQVDCPDGCLGDIGETAEGGLDRLARPVSGGVGNRHVSRPPGCLGHALRSPDVGDAGAHGVAHRVECPWRRCPASDSLPGDHWRPDGYSDRG